MAPNSSSPVPVPLPDVAELDRRLRWRVWPILMFVGLMTLLAAVAGSSLMCPRRIVVGLPEDSEAAAARARVADVPVHAGGLAFASSLFEPAAAERAFGAADARAVAEAESLLERIAARRPLDARVWGALGSLDVAAHRFDRAERRFQRALDLAPHYPDARLGMGVALAMRSRLAGDAVDRRRQALRAIAHLTAVPEDGPRGLEALFDRAVVLDEVGRRAEAEEARRRYAARRAEAAR